MKTRKILVLVLAVAISMMFFTACETDKLEPPEFSIEIEDGDSTIEFTQEDVADLDLYDFSAESKGVTSYYKGYKISEILPAISDLNQDGIESLLVIAADEYEQTLPEANFENAYFAVYYSETEEGEFEFLDDDNGPVRLYDTTSGTEVKSIKQVAKVVVGRAD